MVMMGAVYVYSKVAHLEEGRKKKCNRKTKHKCSKTCRFTKRESNNWPYQLLESATKHVFTFRIFHFLNGCSATMAFKVLIGSIGLISWRLIMPFY